MKIIPISEIKPVGNFDDILLDLRKNCDEIIELCHKDKKYNSKLAKYIGFIGDIIWGLEEDLNDGVYPKDTVWNQDESFICLLYAQLLIIDLNQTAHTYLNPGLCEFESPAKQLQDYLDGNVKKYGTVKITEL